MNFKSIIKVTILGGILFSCQKVYTPDDLNSDKKIPVIQGTISDGDGPYTVSVFYAAAYNSNLSQAIDGANVYIIDDLGTKIILTEHGSGYYTTGDVSFKGAINRKYVLHVELLDGSQFASDTVQMLPKPAIDSITASISTYKDISTNYDGDVVVTDVPGLSINASCSVNTTEPAYFRYVGKAIYQKECTHAAPKNRPGFPYEYYYWTSSTSIYDLPNEQSTILQNGKQIIKNQNIGFLRYEVGSSATDSTSQVLPAGWILTAIAYRISAESYRYYQNVEKQLNATDHFFDPVPSQIKGNMHCITNSDQLVLGLFEVNSEDRKYIAFNWSKGSKTIRRKDLAFFIDTIKAGWQDSIPPGFWQRGYKK